MAIRENNGVWIVDGPRARQAGTYLGPTSDGQALVETHDVVGPEDPDNLVPYCYYSPDQTERLAAILRRWAGRRIDPYQLANLLLMHGYRDTCSVDTCNKPVWRGRSCSLHSVSDGG